MAKKTKIIKQQVQKVELVKTSDNSHITYLDINVNQKYDINFLSHYYKLCTDGVAIAKPAIVWEDKEIEE